VVRFKFLLLAFGIAFIAALSGCSSVGSGVSVSLSSSATTIQQGKTLTVTATVTNGSTTGSSNAGVTWSLSGPGELSNISTTSVTYSAPATVSANTTATVTATSVVNTNVSSSVTITIEAVFEITTFSFPGGTLGVPYTGEVTAGGAATPFTWAITSGSLPSGLTLTTSTSTSFVTVSGTPKVVGTSTFTLQVTTAAGTSVSQTFSITISPPPPLIVVSGSLINGTEGAAYSDTLQAANGVPPYSWSLTSGGLPSGLSLSSAGVISGTAATTGTSTFTVKVTDSSTPTAETATGTLSLTINPNTVNNSKLSGNYAFLVTGFDASGHFTAAGSFVADGAGNITAGIMDSNDPANLLLDQSFNGTYLIGQNDLGTMTFTGIGRTFALAMMADGNAKIIEFDSTGAQDSGVLLKQDTVAFSTSQIVGSYAFGFLGADPQGNRYGFAGAISADGSGNFTSGVLDSDGASGITSDVAFTGTYAVSPNGRGTMALFVSGKAVNCSFYVVSAQELFTVEIDDIAGQNRQIVSGSVLLQTGAGSFSGASLNATSILETTAVQSSAGSFTPQSQVGLLTPTGDVNLAFSADRNTGGTLTSPSSSGTYSVAANGRTTLTNSGIAASDPVLYLVSQNEAFIIGTDPNVTFGFMESQSGTFTDSSLSGTYAGGSLPPLVANAVSEVDAATADGAGNLTFVTDSSSTGSGISQNASSSGTYSVATNGRGTVTENASTTAIFYMASPTEFWSLSTDANATVEEVQQ
jgi:hypothetical protein